MRAQRKNESSEQREERLPKKERQNEFSEQSEE